MNIIITFFKIVRVCINTRIIFYVYMFMKNIFNNILKNIFEYFFYGCYLDRTYLILLYLAKVGL